ncbi:MAG: TonB-dependent receptor, partial [Venatoribacter sp.]
MTLEQTYRDSLQHKNSNGDDAGELTNWSGSYRGRWQPNHTDSIGWAFEVFDRDSQADSFSRGQSYISYEEERRYFGSLDYKNLGTYGELELRASVGQSVGETNRSHPTVETTDFLQYQADAIYHLHTMAEHKLSVGGGIKRDELDVSINSKKTSRNNMFVVAQDQWQFNKAWNFVAGLRYDHYDDFGNSVNPRLSLAWEEENWSARLGYGQGFRAPSLLEQFSSFNRGRFIIQGNTALKAERSSTWEAMLRRNLGKAYIELTLHHNDVKDLIDSESTGNNIGAFSVIEYRNIDKARIRGAELALEI